MRKNFKKLLSLMVLTTVIVAMGGCSNSGKGKSESAESTKTKSNNFSIFAGISSLSPDNSEKTLIKQMNEAMGVTIDWNCISGDTLTEKKNLLLNTGSDLPDAIMGASLTDYELITYGASGMLIPLEDYINKETMPNLMKVIEERPNLLATSTMPDGHIYSLPSISEMGFTYSNGNDYYIGAIPQFTSINKDWLKAVGMEMPKTIDELHDVLVAFRDKDCNGNGDPSDEIPLSFMYGNWCAGMTTLFSAFGFTDYNDQHRAIKDGKVYYQAATENYKAAIKYFHEWYKEGLIDTEAFSQDSSQYIAKGSADDAKLGVYVWWEIPEVVGSKHAASYEYLPFLTDAKGNSGVNLNEQGTTSHASFAVTKECKNVELLLKWVDQLYDPINSMQAIYGPIGEFFAEKPDENGVYKTKTLAEGETEGELKSKLELYGPTRQLSTDFGTYYYMEDRAQQRLKDLKDFWFQNVVNFEYYPSVTYTLEETETINEYISDIQSLTSEQTARWLTEGGIDEEWDSYISQLDSIGLQEVIKAWQDAYDRYQAALK
jgi:putative aldouronate transport system substrate-binding protein